MTEEEKKTIAKKKKKITKDESSEKPAVDVAFTITMSPKMVKRSPSKRAK